MLKHKEKDKFIFLTFKFCVCVSVCDVVNSDAMIKLWAL